MRAAIFALVLFAWLPVAVRAADSPSRCFDTDTNESFPVPDGVEEPGFPNGKMPEIDYNAARHPTGLRWIDPTEGTKILVEKIGVYQGNSIYRCIYRMQVDPTDKEPSTSLVIFGYAALVGKQRLVRPFCIMESDPDIDTFDTRFVCSDREPFALEISRRFHGNGAMYEDYTFVFTSREAYLRERSEGGRRSPEKTYTYDRAGKIVSTKTATEN